MDFCPHRSDHHSSVKKKRRPTHQEDANNDGTWPNDHSCVFQVGLQRIIAALKKKKKKTGTEVSGIMPAIFETGLTSIKQQKWFTETGCTITVTGQRHGHLYYYNSFASKHTCLEHTHTHHRHSPVFLLLFFGGGGGAEKNWSNKIPANVSDQLLILQLLREGTEDPKTTPLLKTLLLDI